VSIREQRYIRRYKLDRRGPMEETSNVAPTQETERKPYVTPSLTDFGSCAEITQGTFINVGADNGTYS
jgi:hypothetical protein